MAKCRADIQWCHLLLMIFCLNGCADSSGDRTIGPDGTQQEFNILNKTDQKISVESLVENRNDVSLFIGDNKWGSTSYRGPRKQRFTVEANEQLPLESGTSGPGIVFTVSGSHDGSSKYSTPTTQQYLSMSNESGIPSGKVIIRDAATVVQTADSLTLADIETPEGDLIPISIRLN